MELQDIIDGIISVIKTIRVVDLLDIAVLSYAVYLILKLAKETRAGQLLKGIVFLIGLFLFSKWIGMKVISYILGKLLSIGLIAIVVLFQPELRRTLEKAGYTRFGLRLSNDKGHSTATWETGIDIICDSCVKLSSDTTGALIVLERQTPLNEQIENGTVLDAYPSVQLFGSIFFNKNPLHDGAVIMREGKVHAAGCFLPKAQKDELIDKALGSRHRAAIGMSENSDAVVIVVSEETGGISVAENGILTQDVTRMQLKNLLVERMITIPEETTWDRMARYLPFISRKKKQGEENSNDEES